MRAMIFSTKLALAAALLGTTANPASAQHSQRVDQGEEIVVSGHRSIARQTPRERIDDVYNVVGFDGADVNEGGMLSIGEGEIVFSTGKGRHVVPLTAVRSFAIEQSNKGLLRGTKGMIASFAPQGIGQVYSLFRPGAQTLTLFYTDDDQGTHGAVLMLPKASSDAAARALTGAGMQSFEMRLARGGSAVGDAPRLAPADGQPHDGHAMEVQIPETAAADIPVAYIASTYEALVQRVNKTVTSYRVYRAGDLRAAEPFLLSTTITTFKKGNAGLRGAVPIVGSFAGKTKITADVVLTDQAGRTLFAESSQSARMLPGESAGATIGLAKQIAAKLEKAGHAISDCPPVSNAKHPTTLAEAER